MGNLKFYNTNGETPPPAPLAPATPAPNKGLSQEQIDQMLQVGLQVGTTVARQRQASGKSANRQARIAACGRKPLFGKKKKAEYEKCLAAAQSGIDLEPSATTPDYSDRGSERSGGTNQTMLYVGVGLGVVVLGVVGYFLMKKFKK